MTTNPINQDQKTQKQKLIKKGLILIAVYFILSIFLSIFWYFLVKNSDENYFSCFPFCGFTFLDLIPIIFLFIFATAITSVVILYKYIKIK